ncbi:glycosyltransferase family 2 protein [bacterium]|nr:glycosyltransferase family 2 protein [bacterium]
MSLLRFKYDFSLSIVIPVFNNAKELNALQERLSTVLPNLSPIYTIIYVDDGSVDDSLKILLALQKRDNNIRIIKLTRNFGQMNAIAAGLQHTSSDIIIIMDADLQDRPEDIEKLVDALVQSGKPMAIAKSSRREDSIFRKIVSRLFNIISKKATCLPYEPGLRIFRAVRREVIDKLNNIKENTASPISLLHWIGIEYEVVELKRDKRYAGKSGYTLRKMMKLSMDRIFAYSLFPIRLSTYIGIILGICASLAISLLTAGLFFGVKLPVFTLFFTVILLLFSLVFIFLGIIGEYLGRIYDEVRGRPRYVIDKIYDKDIDGG